MQVVERVATSSRLQKSPDPVSLQLLGVKKSFASLQVLDEVSMDVPAGKIACILGPSGCGKTTLLNIVAGIIKADEGQVLGVDGAPISYIFQEPRLLPWKTVQQNVEFVLLDRLSGREARETARLYLRMMGLERFADYRPSQLSGGMRQRVAIARAYAYPSTLLLMDEPFQSLDLRLKTGLIKSFLEVWQAQRRTVLHVTHDVQEALLLGDIIYVLSDRPARVQARMSIPRSRRQRSLRDPQLAQLQRELYGLFLGEE